MVGEIADVTLTGAQAGALRESLSNLVINAVQATGRGGKVRIQSIIEPARPVIDSRGAAFDKKQSSAISSAATGGSRLTLVVTDTGPGIPLEAQQKVFEPFYSTKSRGTGLGLAIVQRRVVELGGMVELTSPVKNGHGTRFRITLPLSKMD